MKQLGTISAILFLEDTMIKTITPNEVKACLKQLNIDQYFPEEAMQHFFVRQYKRGDLFCQPGMNLEHLAIIIKGRMKVYQLLTTGKSHLLTFYLKGNIMGDLEFYSSRNSTCFVEAMTATDILMIPYNQLEPIVEKHNQFPIFIAKSLGEKLKRESRSSAIKTTYPLEQRFASYLIAITDQEIKEAYIAEKLIDVAEFLGSSYRQLHRVIRSFVDNGWIEKKGKNIKILDEDALKSLIDDRFM